MMFAVPPKRPPLPVSVVVPTYRRPRLLARCLSALIAQDFDRPFEIVVADDGGDPDTLRITGVWARKARGRPQVRYLSVQPRHGPAAARNAGWRDAVGEVIAFTDDDTIPRPDWLRQGLAALGDDADAVSGQVRVPRKRRPTDYELDASRLDGAEFVTANCFVRRAALEAIGGFDERFTTAWREDSDLFFTLLENQRKVVPAPEAVVVHPIRPAPFAVSLRQQRKVFFDALLYRKHPQLFREKIRSRPPWHYFVSVGALLLGLGALVAGQLVAGVAALLAWIGLTARFCWQRLRHTARTPRHVAEMLLTSIAIPPLATFWRLAGAVRFGALSP